MTSFLALVRDGKLELLDKQGWRECLSKYRGKQIVVTVQTQEEQRSSQSNRYWRGVVVEFFREQWSRERRRPLGLPDYTNDQAHYALVRTFVGEVEDAAGKMIPKPTRDMPASVFSKLIEDAKEHAWQAYQSRIPEPGEMDL